MSKTLTSRTKGKKKRPKTKLGHTRSGTFESRSSEERKTPKTHLRLPDLEFSKTAVLNSLTSRDGQRGYSHAMDEFVDCTARSRDWH